MDFVYDKNGDVQIEFNIDEQIEYENLSPFLLLQPREIAISIAYQLFDVEYTITEEILDEEINDYFSQLHKEIIDNIIDVLFDNGIDVY